MIHQDISPNYQWREQDAALGRQLLRLDGKPEAIRYFAAHCKPLTSDAYWFYLGTLWVNYTGYSDLNLWRHLFSSTRKNRDSSLMKPSELAAFRNLPDPLYALRAHRPGETDWIAYTLSTETAARFAIERGIRSLHLYEIDKADVLCLFLRRGESEILVLDKNKARFVREVELREAPQ